MFHILLFLIAIAIVGVQYMLSRKNNAYWGAILPVLYMVFMTYGWVTDVFTDKNIINMVLATFGGEVVLLSAWVKGREFVKKKREKELEKMKLHDISL